MSAFGTKRTFLIASAMSAFGGKADIDWTCEMSAFDQSGHWAKVAEWALWKINSGSASLQLDVEGPDEVAPLLRFVGDELAKVSGRKRERVATQIGKPRLVLRIGEASVDLLVELVDDLGGRCLRCANAVPAARLIAWQELSHGRDVGQRVGARRGDHREGAQLAGPDVLDRRGHGGERHLHLSAEQVTQCKGDAAIRHMHYVDAGHHLE